MNNLVRINKVKMYGFKGTDSDFKCLDYQYKMNKTFIHEGKFGVCMSGFHFCRELRNVYDYYELNKKNRYFLIQHGDIKSEGNKSATNKIIFLEELFPRDYEFRSKYLLNDSKFKEIYRDNIDGLLLYYISIDSIQDVEYLIINGANIHAHGTFVLNWVVNGNYIDILKLMIEYNDNIHLYYKILLRWAVDNGHTEIVRVLLKRDVDVHADDDYALRWASRNGHTETVRLLLQHNANVHADDDYALRWASRNDHVETVRLLIQYNADIHADDDCALKWASFNCHIEICKSIKNTK